MPGSAVMKAREELSRGATVAAARLVADAARAGDGEAMHELALWHVYGRPVRRDFVAARDYLRRGGEAGHAASARMHAVFVATGAGGPADWAGATMLLGHAARTDPEAARQKLLLDAMALDADGAPPTSYAVEPLSQSPRVGMIRGLLSEAECAHVIGLARPLLAPSIVVDSGTGREMPHPVRTSDGAVLGPIQMDLVVEALNRRIARATATRVEQGEPLAVLRYAPGQEYRLHHDCLPGEINQRAMTLIVYLNDDFDGGATSFPSIGAETKGNVGDAVLFANTRADGGVDARSRHAGLPVARGEKWVCTRWIRSRDFDPWGMRRVAPSGPA